MASFNADSASFPVSVGDTSASSDGGAFPVSVGDTSSSYDGGASPHLPAFEEAAAWCWNQESHTGLNPAANADWNAFQTAEPTLDHGSKNDGVPENVKEAITRILSDGGWREDTHRKCAIIMMNLRSVQEVDRRIPHLTSIQEGIDQNLAVWFYTSSRRKERAGRRWIGDVLVVAHRDKAASLQEAPPKKGIKFDSSEQAPQDLKRNFPNVVVNYGSNPNLGIKARKYQLLSDKVESGSTETSGIGDGVAAAVVAPEGGGGGGGGGGPSVKERGESSREGLAVAAATVDTPSDETATNLDDLEFPLWGNLGNIQGSTNADDLRSTIHEYLAGQSNAEMRRRKIEVIQDVLRQFESDDGSECGGREGGSGGGAAAEDDNAKRGRYRDLTARRAAELPLNAALEATSSDDIIDEVLWLILKALKAGALGEEEGARFELCVCQLESRGLSQVVQGFQSDGVSEDKSEDREDVEGDIESVIASSYDESISLAGPSAEIDSWCAELESERLTSVVGELDAKWARRFEKLHEQMKKSTLVHKELRIHAASYGPGSWHDVTEGVRLAVGNGTFRSPGGVHLILGDHFPGVPKTFIVVYSVVDETSLAAGQKVLLFSCVEGEAAAFGVPGKELRIHGASYGPSQWHDVTGKVRSGVKNNRLRFLGRKPSSNTFTVFYSYYEDTTDAASDAVVMVSCAGDTDLTICEGNTRNPSMLTSTQKSANFQAGLRAAKDGMEVSKLKRMKSPSRNADAHIKKDFKNFGKEIENFFDFGDNSKKKKKKKKEKKGKK
jgi:hypothetical protein